MESCPVEILLAIFIPLCDDGGAMARSLSLVSKHIHQASRGLIFQSVVCTANTQLLRLADMLDAASPEHRTIRHLYISCGRAYVPQAKPEPSQPSTSFKRSLASMWKTKKPEPAPPPIQKQNLGGDVVYNALRRILAHAAPTVRTLALSLTWNSWDVLPLPRDFPLLVELSINHDFAGGLMGSKGFGPIESAPCLERLILSGFTRMVDPTDVIFTIARFTSSITHFGVTINCTNIAPLLQLAAVGMGTAALHERTGAGLGNPMFPNTVRHLLVDCTTYWSHAHGSTAFIKSGRTIAYAQRPDDFRLDNEASLRRHWTARLEGGAGLWTIDDMQITTKHGSHNASNLMRLFDLTSESHSEL